MTKLLVAATGSTSTRAKALAMLELAKVADRLKKLTGKLYKL